MSKKIRGSNRPRLSLRGAHRGESLKARIHAFNALKGAQGYKCPGSGKK